MSSTEADYDDEVAEPFRFNFEIAWEVANKGWYTTRTITRVYIVYACVCVHITCPVKPLHLPLIRTPLESVLISEAS